VFPDGLLRHEAQRLLETWDQRIDALLTLIQPCSAPGDNLGGEHARDFFLAMVDDKLPVEPLWCLFLVSCVLGDGQLYEMWGHFFLLFSMRLDYRFTVIS
jgi:hypothetical protein